MDWRILLIIATTIITLVTITLSLRTILRIRKKIHFSELERLYSRHPFDNRIISHSLPTHRYYGGGELINDIEFDDEKSVYSKKKDKFLNIANISFHYADKERIKTFYNDYFKEPTLKDLIRETISETNSDVKAKVPTILESKIGAKGLSKWISTIKLPDITETGMFKRYQVETIKKDQVKLGLEEDDIELSILSDFESRVSNISKDFDYQFDKNSLEKHRTILKEKAAERTLTNLEKASGWVLIEGNFLIQRENEFYKVSMSHPVSNYLTSGKEISISCLIPINQIEPSVSGNYSNSIEKMIPLTIYGQVWQPINRQNNILELIITPLAIY